jgi:hypothetical protein
MTRAPLASIEPSLGGKATLAPLAQCRRSTNLSSAVELEVGAMADSGTTEGGFSDPPVEPMDF